MKNKMENKIKNHKDAEKVTEYLIATAMKTLGIERRVAELRIIAIIESGILTQFGSPEEQPFQIAIEAAMRIPQLGEKE